MDALAAQLTQEVGHIVQDQTVLKGVYDFTLRYSDELASSSESSAPSIFTALQEQLGLKLESTKGPWTFSSSTMLRGLRQISRR